MVSETDRNIYTSKDHLFSMVNALLGCLNIFSTSKNIEYCVISAYWSKIESFVRKVSASCPRDGYLADRYGQVRTTLVTGCLSRLADVWRISADMCGQRRKTLCFWVSKKAGGQVRTVLRLFNRKNLGGQGRGAEKISCPVPRPWTDFFVSFPLLSALTFNQRYTHLNTHPNQIKMVKEMIEMTFMSSHFSPI